MFSTSGDVQYIRGCSIHQGCSVHRRDIMSTSGDVQYIGGMSTLGDIMSTSGGYHEYIGGCPVHRGDIMSTSGDVQYIGVSIEIERILLTPHAS